MKPVTVLGSYKLFQTDRTWEFGEKSFGVKKSDPVVMFLSFLICDWLVSHSVFWLWWFVRFVLAEISLNRLLFFCFLDRGREPRLGPPGWEAIFQLVSCLQFFLSGFTKSLMRRMMGFFSSAGRRGLKKQYVSAWFVIRRGFNWISMIVRKQGKLLKAHAAPRRLNPYLWSSLCW